MYPPGLEPVLSPPKHPSSYTGGATSAIDARSPPIPDPSPLVQAFRLGGPFSTFRLLTLDAYGRRTPG